MRLETENTGSNYQFQDKLQYGKPPRSSFDLTHNNVMTINNAGAIIPIDCFEVVPSDDFDISVEALLRVMPQVVPLYTMQRIYIHAFYMSYSAMQKGFGTMIKKGYSGNFIGSMAPLNSDVFDFSDYGDEHIVAPDTLADYLRLPIGASLDQLIEDKINAAPFFMYKSIYKYYYMNPNYHINNRNLLPDDDDDFRLNSDGLIISNTDPTQPFVKLGKLLYRDYPDDYFTSALPFAQRGDAPTLPLTLTGGSDLGIQADFKNLPRVGVTSDGGQCYPGAGAGLFNSFLGTYSFISVANNATNGSNDVRTGGTAQVMPWSCLGGENKASALSKFNNEVSQALSITGQDGRTYETNITLDVIRALAISQYELEKMAKTDGSYAEFGLTFFGEASKYSQDFRPVYIGGTYQSISFTEVLQSSASTSNSALGQIAGHGISANNQGGHIGKIHCDDYGLIMICASIMPDVYYSQGLPKMWTNRLQSDFLIPERARLGLQPILNRELYYSGDPEVDNDLFAYQSPYDDMRYRQNEIHGKIADPNNESFYPFTQARHFTSSPVYSAEFAKADDVRKDYLFAPSEDAYSVQFRIGIRATRPLPYQAIPAEILN